MKKGTRNVAAKQAMTRRTKCVARDKFTKAKDESVVERILTTRRQNAAVVTKMCMIDQPSIAVVAKSYNGTVIKVVAGINLTTVKPSTAVMEEFVRKVMKKMLAVERAVTTRTLIFAAKET